RAKPIRWRASRLKKINRRDTPCGETFIDGGNLGLETLLQIRQREPQVSMRRLSQSFRYYLPRLMIPSQTAQAISRHNCFLPRIGKVQVVVVQSFKKAERLIEVLGF